MIFGIDFGLKRIGIAKLLQGIILPIPAIIRKNRNQASKELQKKLLQHCNNLEDITLIIGIPLNEYKDFKDSNTTNKVMIERIKHFLNLMDFCGKVIYIDESYSSIEASNRLSDRLYNKRKRARKDGTLDSISACIILERYLEKQEILQKNKIINSIDIIENIVENNTISQNSKYIKPKESNTSQNLQIDVYKSIDSNSINSISLIGENEIADLEYKHTKDSINTCTKELADHAKYKHIINTESNKSKTIKNIESNKKDKEKTPHIPVLLEHVIDTFDRIFIKTHKHYIQNIKDINTKKVIIDCTFGFGGMSCALLKRYDDLHIIGIDRDIQALEYNKLAMRYFNSRIQMLHGDFGTMLPQIISNVKQNKMQLCGILADIGVSSYQLDNYSRGFSFNSRELDMRMDTTQTLRADMIVNTYSKYELEKIFRDYGEIREYKKLTQLILQERKNKTLTGEHLQNIALQIHTKGKIHPATLIYQALRIAVNDELSQLQSLLKTCSTLKDVMLCIISFHSLEDRIIKDSMKQWAKSCICDESSFKCTCGNNHAKGFSLYKKPLVADSKELESNKRARSAKLRAFYFN